MFIFGLSAATSERQQQQTNKQTKQSIDNDNLFFLFIDKFRLKMHYKDIVEWKEKTCRWLNYVLSSHQIVGKCLFIYSRMH